MDPSTVSLILSLHLVCTGGLFYLIGRQMPPRSGLDAFGLGAIVFGAAYALRLHLGNVAEAPAGALLDTAMILAALMFISGLRQFVGRAAPAANWIAGALVAYLLLRLAAEAGFEQVGPHLLQNVTLGTAYLVLAVGAALESRRQPAALRMPLRVLVLLMTGLGGMTVARGVVIFLEGPSAIYAGPMAQAYYAYASLSAVLLGPNLLWMVFARLNGQLAELATHDALTRLLNRNGLDEMLRRHFAARESVPLTLLQVDIDRFKQINDSHGHVVGDAVLRTVAGVLASRMRAEDFVARTGGEEFLVGCSGGDVAMAHALSERLREAVAQAVTPLRGSASGLRCTISIGMSLPFTRLEDWQAAARDADAALYAAKSGGRDRVVATDMGALNA